MAYTDFNPLTPSPTTQTPGQAFTSDRQNLLSLRDALIASAGFMPGWNCVATNNDGSTPPVPASTPAKLFYSKGTERVRVTLVWTNGYVTRMYASYSANSGVNYDAIRGDTANGYCDITYDGSGNFLSAAWS